MGVVAQVLLVLQIQSLRSAVAGGFTCVAHSRFLLFFGLQPSLGTSIYEFSSCYTSILCHVYAEIYRMLAIHQCCGERYEKAVIHPPLDPQAPRIVWRASFNL